MSCGLFTSVALMDTGQTAGLTRIPHLPVVWPRCPKCMTKLARVRVGQLWRCPRERA